MEGKKYKVLVIDDIIDNQITLNALISDAFDNIDVFMANDGLTGINLANQLKPDVILLDVIMPGMNGYEVCHIFKNDDNLKHIPVVFVTALRADKESRIEALNCGADGFLTKPIDDTELTAQMKAMLRIKEAEDKKLNENEQLKHLVEERTFELQNELNAKLEIEKALKEKEHAYELVLDNVNEIIYSVSYTKGIRDGQVKFVSKKVYNILGYYPDDFINNPKLWLSLIHPDDIENVINKTKSGYINGQIDVRTYRMRHKHTGEYIWIEDHPQLIFDEYGTLTGQFGTALDVSRRKFDELQIIENYNFIKSLLQTIPFGIEIVDSEGNILFQNDILINAFGKPTKYHKCWENYRDDKNQCVDCPLHKEIIVGKTDVYEASGILGGKIFEISHTGIMFKGKKALLEVFQDITERKKAELVFKEVSQRFSELVSSTDGIVWEADAETFQFNFVSNNAERILGYTEQEWLGKDFWSNNIIDEDKKSTIEYCREKTFNGLDHEFEYRFRAKDGRIVWLADYVKVINENGTPKYLHGLMVDITSKKKAELDLLKSEERYRSFISQVSEGVYRFECTEPLNINLPIETQIDHIYDNFFIAECNDSFVKMYGCNSSDDIIGKGHLHFHGDRNNIINRQSLRIFIENDYRVEGVITEEKDIHGNNIFFNNNSVGILENGKLVRMWGTQTDFTDKLKSELVKDVLFAISKSALEADNLSELLETIQLQLGRLINSDNFYIAFYDKKTGMLSTEIEKDEKDSIQSWPAEKSMTGYIIKAEKSMLLAEEDFENLLKNDEINLIGTLPKQWLGVPLLVNKEVIGAIVVQSYDNESAYDDNDKLMLEFIAHQLSIPIERKIKDNELLIALNKAQESDRLKSAFLANMSHEIRTPLNSIIGFSELMQDEQFSIADLAEFALMINKSGRSLLEIISDIMDISKIEVGQITISKFEFKVINLLIHLQKTYSIIASQKDLELQIKANIPDNFLLKNDENRISQVLTNFISNAIKFSNKGKIEIGAYIVDNKIVFYVSDSGIGIAKNYQKSIFERFVQVENSNKRKYGGTGLGLAISKSLVELIGGKIWLNSEEGKGSTFGFELPLE